MGEPPRRLEPSERERIGVLASRMAPGSDQGQSRFGHDIPEPDIGPHGISAITVVVHGDDGAVPRPLAEIVMWVGAATPIYAVDYDFYYPASIG